MSSKPMEIKEIGAFPLSVVFELLDESLFALENIPDQKIPDGQGGTTKMLATKIKWLLEGRDDKRQNGCKNEVSAE